MPAFPTHLVKRIINGNWIGKEILKLSSEMSQSVNNSLHWFENQPLITKLKGAPVLYEMVEEYAGEQNLGDLVKGAALSLMETAYSMNRISNSQKAMTGGISAFEVDKTYIEASQELLEMIDEFSANEKAGLAAGYSSPWAAIADEEQQQLINLQGLQASLSAKYESSKGSERTKARTELRQVEKALELSLSGGVSANLAPPPEQEFYENITKFTTVMTKEFMLLGEDIEAEIPGISAVVSSILLKLNGVSGADSMTKYGAIAFVSASPAVAAINVVSKAGLLTRIFTFIKNFWIPILLILILGMIFLYKIRQRRRTKFSQIIYIFCKRVKGSKNIDAVVKARLKEVKLSRDVAIDMVALANETRIESRESYQEIIGFGLSSKEVPAISFDLSYLAPRQRPSNFIATEFERYVVDAKLE